MNRQTRNEISLIIKSINVIIDKICDISSGEEEKLDSIPENLSNCELYKNIEDAIDFMSSAVDCLEEAIENLEACNENN